MPPDLMRSADFVRQLQLWSMPQMKRGAATDEIIAEGYGLTCFAPEQSHYVR
jgi:hypothetical protein